MSRDMEKERKKQGISKQNEGQMKGNQQSGMAMERRQRTSISVEQEIDKV